jgi:hypothetical protein
MVLQGEAQSPPRLHRGPSFRVGPVTSGMWPTCRVSTSPWPSPSWW